MALETCWETAFQAAVLAFVGILLTIMIGAACGLLLGGFDIFFYDESCFFLFLGSSKQLFCPFLTCYLR
jgi:hypothetical protein